MDLYGQNGDGGKTVAFGTAIQYLIPPDRRGYTHITDLTYTDGGTPHTVTLMRPLGRQLVSGANAAGQAVLNIVADPGAALLTPDTIATNDFLAVREKDGITRAYKVSSVASLTAITLTTNLVVGTNGGEAFWFFGVVGDTDQRTGNPHPNWLTVASTALVLGSASGGGVATLGKDEPILFNSNNATAAGKLNLLYWGYSLT